LILQETSRTLTDDDADAAKSAAVRKLSVSDIRDWLVAELGDVPLQYVAEYLAALQSIDVVREIQQ
jgi:hypothetical protein